MSWTELRLWGLQALTGLRVAKVGGGRVLDVWSGVLTHKINTGNHRKSQPSNATSLHVLGVHSH